MTQVHGTTVVWVDELGAPPVQEQPVADGLLTSDRAAAVLVADCLPILWVAETAEGRGLAAAVHAGRKGVAANIVRETAQALRARGGVELEAWIGPSICGACYEVPEELRAEVASAVPETFAQTSWGTPSLDLRAGAQAQLEAEGVRVHRLDVCTLEDRRFFSHRGGSAGRFAGIVYRSGS